MRCFKQIPEQVNEVWFPEFYSKINVEPYHFKPIRYGENLYLMRTTNQALSSYVNKIRWIKMHHNDSCWLLLQSLHLMHFWLIHYCLLVHVTWQIFFLSWVFHSLFSDFISSLLVIYTDITINWSLNRILMHFWNTIHLRIQKKKSLDTFESNHWIKLWSLRILSKIFHKNNWELIENYLFSALTAQYQ